ncbi:hypothetical protein [Mesoflavibacter zeaxanthinifaciens]|uniref:hypothetical protein n=1 Tax=Mesoflavibacter zeaxanthinifaciens TaxID=393060 RepID=UPI003A8F1B77
MDSGYYFICEEDADITHTHVLFYYKAVGSGNVHPLYLTFGKDRIDFFFNGDINKHLERKTNKEFIETPPLFSLPLAKDKGSVNALEEQLASLYKGKFPIMSGNKRSAGKDDYRLREDIERGDFSYKAARVIERFPEINADDKSDEKITHKEKKINILFYRDLILDFLFDLKHKPEVFEASPNFKKVSALIRDSFILQAIAAKAEFYFQFAFLGEVNPSNEHNFDLSIDNKKGIEEIKDSYLNWASLLQENEASSVINESNSWFDDVETEMTNALHYKKENFNNNENQKLKSEINQSAEKLTESISKWFIERNNILKAWMNNTCFEKGIFWASLFLILYSIVTIWLSIYEMNKIPCEQWDLITVPWIYLIPALIILFGTIFCFILSKNKIIRKTKSNKNKQQNRKKLIFDFLQKLFKKINGLFKYAMIPLWVMIFGATHVVFNTGSFYNRLFIDNDWTHQLSGYFILLLLAIFLYKIYTGLNNKYPKRRKPIRYIIAPILCLIFIVFLLFYLKNISLAPFSLNALFFFFVILFILISVLYNHEREAHPNLHYTTSFDKTFSMLFYGLVISFFTNLFYINTEYKEYLERYEYLGHIWHHTEKFEESNADGTYTFDETKKAHYKFGYYIDLKDVTDTCLINTNKFEIELESNVKDFIGENGEEKSHSLFGYDKKSHGNYYYYEKVKRAIYQPLSDDIEVTIDKYFFEELQNVYLFKEVGENEYKKSAVPVLKKINLNGISLITMPSVLFINTFLSLIVAVLLQIFLHKAKFLKGGGGH